MFDELSEDHETDAGSQPSSRLRGLLKSRALWGSVGVLLGLLLLVVGGGLYGVQAALLSDSCESGTDDEFSILAMIALKNKRSAYRQDDSEDAVLELSSAELNFLLRDLSHFGVWLSIHGERVTAHLTSPDSNGCYNLDFVGDVEVRDGVLYLTPETLEVGGFDLSFAVAATVIERQADEVRDLVLSKRIGNLRSLNVVNGHVHLQLIDRWANW